MATAAIRTSDDATVVTLTGDLIIDTVASLRPALLDGLAQPGDLTLDLAAVDACDTAGIQLLLATAAAARLRSKELRLTAAAPAVRAAAARIGIAAASLGLPGQGEQGTAP